MKFVKFSLVTITLLATAIATNAQSADDIVNKHIDALGGKDKLSQVKTIYMETSAQIMGNEAPNTITIEYGKGFKSETDFNGSKFVQCYTDKGGWTINPMAGGGPEAMPEDQYKSGKDQLQIGGPLFDYAAKGYKVELLGNENGTYKLKATGADSLETTYFVDGKTWYITKILKKGNVQGQDVEITINLSDYRKTDFGYVMPYAVDTDFGGQFQVSATVKKVEINKPVDEKIFEMPAK